ncbi:MAG: FAD:protein FMN transferase [Endozoicomonas sp. (ex Botrylloides leachii)]|nr:FAD:protein FMN transferase [Endozoicomonas sp. (ex Botrylloides leachii)]
MISKSYKRSLLLGGILLVAVFYMLSKEPREKKFEGKTMGTTYHVSYIYPLFSNSVADTSKKVYDSLHDVDLRMSTYRENSELMRFNRAPLNKPIKLSPAIVAVVKESQAVSALSGGAYDVTVGPLVNLWGFGPKDQDPKASNKHDKHDVRAPEFIDWMLNHYPVQVPSKAAIEKARDRVGYRYVIANTENNTLTRTRPVFVDLSSIAKGYGVDQAARTLDDLGIDSYLVEVGGEVRSRGKKADGSPWRVAINKPDLSGGRPEAIVELGNKGMATSGDYLNFFELNGKRYSHEINPVTGMPVMNRLAEVAVIRDTVTEADALATMFMVFGDKKGLAFANKHGIAAYFTYHDGHGFKSVASDAFKPYLVAQKKH